MVSDYRITVSVCASRCLPRIITYELTWLLLQCRFIGRLQFSCYKYNLYNWLANIAKILNFNLYLLPFTQEYLAYMETIRGWKDAATFRPMIGTLWIGRVLYRATNAVAQSFGVCRLTLLLILTAVWKWRQFNLKGIL